MLGIALMPVLSTKVAGTFNEGSRYELTITLFSSILMKSFILSTPLRLTGRLNAMLPKLLSNVGLTTFSISSIAAKSVPE